MSVSPTMGSKYQSLGATCSPESGNVIMIQEQNTQSVFRMALCIRRTRTDADGRGQTRIFKKKKKFGIHRSTGPIGARVRPLGLPPTHHDLMKIY